jgi:hypothetical protein
LTALRRGARGVAPMAVADPDGTIDVARGGGILSASVFRFKASRGGASVADGAAACDPPLLRWPETSRGLPSPIRAELPAWRAAPPSLKLRRTLQARPARGLLDRTLAQCIAPGSFGIGEPHPRSRGSNSGSEYFSVSKAGGWDYGHRRRGIARRNA